MSTKITYCSCPSSYADAHYGPGLRVHNHAPKKGTERFRYRCTVCGREKDVKGDK